MRINAGSSRSGWWAPRTRSPPGSAKAPILSWINRFGKLEAKGKGLIDLIRRAGEADIPVLIAVPEHRFETWTRYSCGMSVRVACNRRALDRWWQSVSHGANCAGAARTLCAIAK
jgi:hypothetical protein